MHVLGLDHLVLTVASIAESVRFYGRLGFREVQFGEGRHALAFGSQKINLHQADRTFEPKALCPTPGSADLCFVVAALAAVTERLDREGIPVEEGPVRRTGATGPILSLYIRDPDGNLLEFSEYERDA